MKEQEQRVALPRPQKVTSYEPMGCGAETDEDGNQVIRFVINPMEHVIMTISAQGAVGLREQLPAVAIDRSASRIVTPS